MITSRLNRAFSSVSKTEIPPDTVSPDILWLWSCFFFFFPQSFIRLQRLTLLQINTESRTWSKIHWSTVSLPGFVRFMHGGSPQSSTLYLVLSVFISSRNRNDTFFLIYQRPFPPFSSPPAVLLICHNSLHLLLRPWSWQQRYCVSDCRKSEAISARFCFSCLFIFRSRRTS